MELVLQDAQSSVMTVSDTSFGSDFNEALVHQVVVAYSASSRQGTSAQKSRAEVTGSNKKPWRQKGTGKSRAGSIKSPIWRSGGVTFAAKTQNYNQKVNKKMYRGAMKSILSELIRQGRLIVVKQFLVEVPKTKLLEKKIKDMKLANALIITDDMNTNLFLAARNIHTVDVRNIKSIDPVSLIIFDKVVMTANAVKQLEEMLA